MLKMISKVFCMMFFMGVMADNKPFCFGNQVFMQTIENKKIYWEPYNIDQCYEINIESIDHCKLCKEIIEELQTLLETEESRVILEYLCNELPEPSNKVCEMMIDRVIEEFEKLDSHEFCEWIKIC
jgi:hypothetical protein